MYLILLCIFLLIIEMYYYLIAHIARIVCDFNYYECRIDMKAREYLPYMMPPRSGTIMIIRNSILFILIILITIFVNIFVGILLLFFFLFYRFFLSLFLIKYRLINLENYVIKKLKLFQKKWILFFENESNFKKDIGEFDKDEAIMFFKEISNDILNGIKNFEENAYK
ncbi:MAG: hypothetical protein ACOXZR_04795 [Bacilli bacterium]|jgi:hypothetical protein